MIYMDLECPKCKKKECESLGEDWCQECKKKMEKFVCMNCLTSFFICGHVAPEKRQCTSTKSR